MAQNQKFITDQMTGKAEGYLRVLEEGFLVVGAAASTVWLCPCSMGQALMPHLAEGEERRIHHTTDGRLVKVLAEVFKSHPGQFKYTSGA